MNNKVILGVVGAVVVIALGVYFVNRTPVATETSSLDSTSEEQNNVESVNSNKNAAKSSTRVSASQGHVVFSVTDAAADMQTISEINMKISKVEMHSNAQGWVVVSSTPKTYDLLNLKARNESELLVDAAVKAGTYDQVRLKIDSVTVKTKNGSVRTAKMPSSELKTNTKVVMSANEISSVNFDFLADKSLHATGGGEFIFAPVVKIESRSGAGVDIDTSDNTVTVVGGDTDSASVVGMDVDGSVKVDFQIDAKQTLTIDGSGKIKIQGVLQ